MQYTLDFFDERRHDEREKPVKGEEPGLSQAERMDGCKYCNINNFRLHPGAIYFCMRGGEWWVIADIDHVYNSCKDGLISNIRALKRLFDKASAWFRVFAVGKAFDDDLYVFTTASKTKTTPEWGEFKDMEITIIRYDDFEIGMKFLKRESSYMETVEPETVREALGHQAGGSMTDYTIPPEFDDDDV